MNRPGQNLKIFNDPIHGHIELHPVCVAVIDTPQFQRLRFIKQLGMCYFVYPGAAHNRFEHSIGVCYLAGHFVRTLQENQPDLGITGKDLLCVELAGLCHDLGHGPFSHLYDGKFMPFANPGRNFKHEKASIDMFDYLIEQNELMNPKGIMYKYNFDDDDILFIKEMIYGPLNGLEFKGRNKEKAYLYEIVSNKRNSIDVDKWDYFARDCHHLGIKNNFDHMRFMKFARAIQVKGEWQICIRDKEVANLYCMFYTRYILHKQAYQDKVNCAVEIMVAQALLKADPYIKCPKKDGSCCRISECIDDMFAFTDLTDDILFKILYSECQAPDMLEAKEIIKRIFCRNLYTCVYESIPIGMECLSKMNLPLSSMQVGKASVQTTTAIRDDLIKKANAKGKQLAENDLVVQIAYLDFGMKEKNPVEKLLVYSKKEPNIARHLPHNEASIILGPIRYCEMLVRVYSCNKETKETLTSVAQQWCVELMSKLEV